MNIPDKVKIGGFNYNVIKKTRVNKGDVEVDGEIFYDQCEIVLRDNMEQAQDYKEMVLLHECLHGIFFSMGLKQDDEGLISSLGKGLHVFIKDNPNIFKESDPIGNEESSKSDHKE